MFNKRHRVRRCAQGHDGVTRARPRRRAGGIFSRARSRRARSGGPRPRSLPPTAVAIYISFSPHNSVVSSPMWTIESVNDSHDLNNSDRPCQTPSQPLSKSNGILKCHRRRTLRDAGEADVGSVEAEHRRVRPHPRHGALRVLRASSRRFGDDKDEGSLSLSLSLSLILSTSVTKTKNLSRGEAPAAAPTTSAARRRRGARERGT